MRSARIIAFLVVALAGRAALAVDYSPITYGAIGDTKYETDCSTTIGTGTVVCPNAGFVNGDVGKVMWCISIGAGAVNPLIAVTAIASRASGTQVVTTAHANDTVNNSARCAWGTHDDTAGIQGAVAAASSAANPAAFTTPPGRVLFPCGGFQVSGRILNVLDTSTTVPQIVGGGPDCTVLILRPDMTTIPGDGTGALIQTTGEGLTFRDFAIEGLDMPFAWNVDQDLIRLAQVSNVTVERVHITNLGGTGGGYASALALRDVSGANLLNVFIQGSPATGVFTIFAMKFVTVGNVLITGSTISNFDNNLYVGTSHGRTPTTAGITWVGGLIDECFLTGGCLQLHDAEMSIIGATVYGNGAGTPITVDGTSRLWITDGNVGAFNAIGDVPPMTVAAGGLVVSRGTTWRTNGAAKLTNSGTFVDGGGNNYQNCSGNTCNPKSASQSFSGNLPVTTWPNNVLAVAPASQETKRGFTAALPFILIGAIFLVIFVAMRFRRRT